MSAPPKYFVLGCEPGLTEDHFSLSVAALVRSKRWKAGILFDVQDTRDGFQPPLAPIEIETEIDSEVLPRVYPEYTSQPIPLMTHRLVNALQSAGVDNLQSYTTTLKNRLGATPPSPDHYLAINIVGCIAAADLALSKLNPQVADRMISTDFFSLAIAEQKTRGTLMFRLAENISAVLVHERVKAHVEDTGIATLTWYAPEQWAG